MNIFVGQCIYIKKYMYASKQKSVDVLWYSLGCVKKKRYHTHTSSLAMAF